MPPDDLDPAFYQYGRPETPTEGMKRIEASFRPTAQAGRSSQNYNASVGMEGPLSAGVSASADPYSGAPQSVGANVGVGPITYSVNQPTVRGAPMAQTVSAGVPFDADSYFGVNATRTPSGMQYGANVSRGGFNAFGEYDPQHRGYTVGGGYRANFAKGGDVRPVVGHTRAAGEPISLEEHKGEIRHRAHSGDSKMAADYGYLDYS